MAKLPRLKPGSLEPYSKEYFDRIKHLAAYRPRLKRLEMAVLAHKPKRVLDVGCGHGFLVQRLLNRGIEAVGIDFSPLAGELIGDKFMKVDATQRLPFPNQAFDVVISTDFFEHLRESDVSPVYAEMCRVGKRVIANICFKHEKVSDSHLTVKPRGWWEEKLLGCEIL